MTVDMRLLAYRAGRVGPVPELIAAPVLAVSAQRPLAWRRPPGPLAVGRQGSPGGRGLTGSYGNASRLGVTPGATAAEAQVGEWWRELSARLHRAIYQRATSFVTGVALPREAVSPLLAREYLALLLQQMGAVHGWPVAEVESRAAAIRSTTPAPTVVATVDRIVSAFGPVRSWEGAGGWYDIAASLRRSAALASAGEAFGLWSRVTRDAMAQAAAVGAQVADGARAIMPRVDQMIRIGSKVAPMVGAGFGLATAAIAGGVLAVMFWPELGAGYKAAKSRATSRGGS